MEKGLAAIVAKTAFRSSAEISNLLPIIKEFSSAEEYNVYLA
jgi:hypothetical protein